MSNLALYFLFLIKPNIELIQIDKKINQFQIIKRYILDLNPLQI